MRMIEVRRKKDGVIRTITPSAYAALGSKIYERLRDVDVDQNGNVIGQSPNLRPQERKVEVVAPVVKLRPPVEETASEAYDPTNEEQQEEQKPAPKKRGPKPKNISSSNTDAQ